MLFRHFCTSTGVCEKSFNRNYGLKYFRICFVTDWRVSKLKLIFTEFVNGGVYSRVERNRIFPRNNLIEDFRITYAGMAIKPEIQEHLMGGQHHGSMW